MTKPRPGRVIGWRFPQEILDAIADYAVQTRRNKVSAAIVLIEAGLKAATLSGEYTPRGKSEQRE